MSNKERNSNLELFRIITMLLIISHHYVVNSGLIDVINENMISPNSLFLLVFGAWGKAGINCFLLITGYFMCKSNITIKKFIKLLFEVSFYKIIFWIIFLLTGYESFSLEGMVKAILPVTKIASNFLGCYLLFFLCIPFLNILISNMTEKMHIYLIALCSFIYIILGSLPKIDVVMNYVSWFSVIYIIGSYIRCYPKKILENEKIWGIITIFCIFVSVVSILGGAYVGYMIDKPLYYYLLSDSNKIFAVITAISAFLFFKNLKLKKSKFINTIAASTFGVLLVHANSYTMIRWLWKDFLNNVDMYNSKLLVVHAVGSVVGIFIVGTVIDYIRIHLLEKPVFKYFENRKNCN